MLGINAYAKSESGEAVHIIPQARISAMDCAFYPFSFIVMLNEFTFGFQSVSGFSIEKSVDYISEGGVNDHEIMVGRPSYEHPTLTFRRGMIMRSPTILSQVARAAAAAIPVNMVRQQALLRLNMLDPQESLDSGPSLGTIQVFNRERKLRALYSFFSLGTISWRADDLDATSGSILCEEFTVAHTGLIRHPVDPVPPIARSIMSLVSDAETLSNAQSASSRAEEIEERRKAAEELKRKKEEELALISKKREEEKELEKEKKEKERLEEERAKKEEELRRSREEGQEDSNEEAAETEEI